LEYKVDFSFLEFPILIGGESEVYSLRPGGSIEAVEGIGAGCALKALRTGINASISWLVTDKLLVVFFRRSRQWRMKDISDVARPAELMLREYYNEDKCELFLCLSFGKDVYTLIVSNSNIKELRLVEPVALGFLTVVNEKTLSYIGEWRGRICQLLTQLDELETNAYPIFDDEHDGYFFDSLSRMVQYTAGIFNSPGYTSQSLTDCFAGLEFGGDYYLFARIGGGYRTKSTVLIRIDVAGNKSALEVFSYPEFISQHNISKSLSLVYLGCPIKQEIICVKFDCGKMQWGRCSFGNSGLMYTEGLRFAYCEEVGVYSLALKDDQLVLVASGDALEFSELLRLDQSHKVR
jgi:hypothetical protein